MCVCVCVCVLYVDGVVVFSLEMEVTSVSCI